MICDRGNAIEKMNQWGTQENPFLFIIDFEMKEVRLYPTDKELPDDISFAFCSVGQGALKKKISSNYYFRKYPVRFSVYQKAFAEAEKQIKAGNSFLLNLTFPTLLDTNLTLREIYEYSVAKYKILIEDKFVCFSPEPFVTIKNGHIASYPMKGTVLASTFEAEKNILNNVKETAEHYTIVDLIRNDLSIVATDIAIKRFRFIDRLNTNQGDILQVSSEITGKLPANYYTQLGTIIFKLLPAGSVTGAPKNKTTAIIRDIEEYPRGYYTGIFGYFDGKNLDSAVMIRFIEIKDNKLWFRSGGGITCNSDVQSEYQELINKVYVPFV
jgi:para-aminobenzoate synthetase component I